MSEDPLKAEIAGLEKQITVFFKDLLEISKEMIQGGYTTHPIFIAHRGNVNFGEKLIDAAELQVPWFIDVALLEDFEEKGIIQPDRVEVFKQTYKDPTKTICIFWVNGENARFIFYPQAGKNSDTA